MKGRTVTLESVLKRPENQLCADCHANAPRWASINIGVFMCIDCSGVHRDMGTHISKVRSVALDEWSQDSIDLVAAVGNQLANAYYEHNLPKDFQRPQPSATDSSLANFIRAKYEKRKWIPAGSVTSPADKFRANEEPASAVPASAIKPTTKPKLTEEPLSSNGIEKPVETKSRTHRSRKQTIASPQPMSTAQKSKGLLDDLVFDEPASASSPPLPDMKQAKSFADVISPAPKAAATFVAPTHAKSADVTLLDDFWSAPPEPFAYFDAPTPQLISTQEPVKQSLGYAIDPPTVRKIQEAKTVAAKESQETLILRPHELGFGEPTFPPIRPAMSGQAFKEPSFQASPWTTQEMDTSSPFKANNVTMPMSNQGTAQIPPASSPSSNHLEGDCRQSLSSAINRNLDMLFTLSNNSV